MIYQLIIARASLLCLVATVTTAMVHSTVLVAAATGGVVRSTMAAKLGTVTWASFTLLSTATTAVRDTDSQCGASGIDYLSCEIWNISQDILDYWGDNKVGGYAPLSVAKNGEKKSEPRISR